MGDAINELRKAAIPLEAPLQGYQYAIRGAQKIPIHGGPGTNGTFNAINTTWGEGGISPVTVGSSFVQVVSFDGSNCPDTKTILTYSQSADPTSPWYADQTLMFSLKQWKTDEFCENQIAADPTTKVTALSESVSAGATAGAPVQLPNSTPGTQALPLALLIMLGLGFALSSRALPRQR
jgi:acyl-homoserine-lactone acylase